MAQRREKVEDKRRRAEARPNRCTGCGKLIDVGNDPCRCIPTNPKEYLEKKKKT